MLNTMKTLPEPGDGESMKIVLASSMAQRLAPLAEGLWTLAKAELYQAGSVIEVMELLKTKPMELVVIDERLNDGKGLDLAKRIAQEQPFVNCVLVSESAAEDFHEETEGLGVLMQLNSPPDIGDSQLIVTHLEAIRASQFVS